MAYKLPKLPKLPKTNPEDWKLPDGIKIPDSLKDLKLPEIKPKVEVTVGAAPLIIGGALAVALIYFASKR